MSPSRSSTCGWSRWAMRRSALSGSPCDPVETIDELLVGPVVELARRDEQAVRAPCDVLSERADVDVLAHRAADEADLAPERGRGVDDLLHAVDVRGEARDDDAALAAPEDARRAAGPTIVSLGEKPGRSAFVESPHSSSTPLAAELGQPAHVGGRAVDRRLVELVVAGDEHRPDVAGRGDRARVRDRVRHVDELDVERARPRCARPGCTSTTSTSWSLCSSSLERAIAIVSGPPKTGMSAP